MYKSSHYVFVFFTALSLKEGKLLVLNSIFYAD